MSSTSWAVTRGRAHISYSSSRQARKRWLKPLKVGRVTRGDRWATMRRARKCSHMTRLQLQLQLSHYVL